ncbi:MAG: hypothetical protein OXH70_03995 [Acidobacteria bacterium]|nr:hypothetical protein [Acidobacteriota bacterium]
MSDRTNLYFTRSEGYRIGGGNNFRVCTDEEIALLTDDDPGNDPYSTPPSGSSPTRLGFRSMIDTLATARNLEHAGMDAGQAEAVADALRAAVTEGGVTRADLADLELRLTRRMYALAIAQAGATVALTVTLLRLLAG